MNNFKNTATAHRDFIFSIALLFIVYIFEYLVSPKLIPNYPSIQSYRILLITTGLTAFILLLLFNKKALVIKIIYLVIFSVSRIDEVLYILPKIYRPDLLLSFFIISNFFTIFILIFYSNYSASKITAGMFFVFSIIYEFLYFQKMKGLSPIIVILVITSSVATALISRLLKREIDRKKVIKKLYDEEVILKNKIALMKGRIYEQEKSFSLSMLTAGIAHELGNPINYLQGNLFFIEDYIESLLKMINKKTLNNTDLHLFEKIISDYKSILNYSKSGFKNITGIINNMKEIYGNRLESRERTDLKELLIRTIDFFKVSHNNNNYTIKTNIDTDLFVNIHPGEYYILFSNLLSNALESLDEENFKGIINISSYKLNGIIVVNISDNGCGISEEFRSRIYDPFFSTKKIKNNLGLGLALCKEIVESNGGKIKIESKKSEGTSVTITMKEFSNGF